VSSTHDDKYYSRARLTCEGLTLDIHKGELDSNITTEWDYLYNNG
jgi:hypothetical protein